MGLLDNLKEKFSEGAERVKFETDKMQRVSRLRSESNDLQQQINTSFGQLGQRAYEMYKDGNLSSPEIASLVTLIDDLQRRIQTTEQQLQDAQNDKFEPQLEQVPSPEQTYQSQSISIEQPAHAQAINPPEAVDAGQYACPNCGANLSPDSAFCPNCGQSVQHPA